MGKRPKLEVNGVLTKQGLRAITCANLLLRSLPIYRTRIHPEITWMCRLVREALLHA